MRGLMGDPAVGKQLEQLGQAFDRTKMEALFKEAGVTSAAGRTPR